MNVKHFLIGLFTVLFSPIILALLGISVLVGAMEAMGADLHERYREKLRESKKG